MRLLIPVNQLKTNVPVDKHVDKSNTARFYLFRFYGINRKITILQCLSYDSTNETFPMTSGFLVYSEIVKIRISTIVDVLNFYSFCSKARHLMPYETQINPYEKI